MTTGSFTTTFTEDGTAKSIRRCQRSGWAQPA